MEALTTNIGTSTSPGIVPSVLIVDDDPDFIDLVVGAIEERGMTVTSATDADSCLSTIAETKPDLIFLDLVLPGATGTSLLDAVIEASPTSEVVLLTGHYTPETAVHSIQMGASDYWSKPVSIHKLIEKVESVAEKLRIARRAHQIETEMLNTFCFSGMVGRSPLMLDVFTTISRIAPHFETALIAGQTGTGKELIARALHNLSPVSKAQFAVCNCAALVETLTESELFGYVKGAFTGANADKMGLFEFANGGTVFLDEIGEMPLPLQAKLLRVLQNKEVQRVGSPLVRKVNVKVIAATHRNLQEMVRAGTFREDLYYRLSMLEIRIPSLAERPDDIPLLAQYFLERATQRYGRKLSGISNRAKSLLLRHDWPGNVRELENVIGSASIMARGEILDVEDLPPRMREAKSFESRVLANCTLDQMERQHTLRVLERVHGNKVQAAEILGISRATLYRILDSAGKTKNAV